MRENGGFLVHIIIFVYLSVILAVVCDNYFLKSLEYISEGIYCPVFEDGAVLTTFYLVSPQFAIRHCGCHIHGYWNIGPRVVHLSDRSVYIRQRYWHWYYCRLGSVQLDCHTWRVWICSILQPKKYASNQSTANTAGHHLLHSDHHHSYSVHQGQQSRLVRGKCQ